MAYMLTGRRSGIWKPTLAGVAVILLADGGYRLASARYAQLADSTPIPEGTLAAIPLTIGPWSGRDVPMDPTVIRYTDTDDHVHRRYARGLDAVTLYVAYGVRIRDLAPHRPEVCYIGAGWVLDRHELQDIQTDGGPLPVLIQTFHRGEFEKEKVTVLSYYLVNGIYSADVSGLRRQVWRLDRADAYSAQVQIVCGDDSDRAEALVKAFAVDAADLIRSVITGAVAGSRPASRVDAR